MDIKENIRKLRTEAGLTQEQLAEKVDVSRSTVTQWESGWSQPRMGKVAKLAEVFGVSPSAIIDSQTHSDLPPGAVIPAPSKPAYAPLLGRVHAGDAQEPELSDEMVSLPHEVRENHPEAYFLKVEGNCMSRVYPDGSMILIDPTHEPQNGSIAVVSIDGADYVMRKLFRTQHTMVLSPDSWEDDHEDIVITSDDERSVEFVGTVVWFQAAEEME